jgi:hypothetical protein
VQPLGGARRRRHRTIGERCVVITPTGSLEPASNRPTHQQLGGFLLAGDHVVVDQQGAGRGASVLYQVQGVGDVVLEETPTASDHPRSDEEPELVDEP